MGGETTQCWGLLSRYTSGEMGQVTLTALYCGVQSSSNYNRSFRQFSDPSFLCARGTGTSPKRRSHSKCLSPPNLEHSLSNLHKVHVSVDAVPRQKQTALLCVWYPVCLQGRALFVGCLKCCAEEFTPSDNEDPVPVNRRNDMMKTAF